MPIIRNIVIGTGCTQNKIELICKAGGITAAQLDDASLQLTLDQNFAIMDAALTISGNQSLGLDVGQKTTAVVLGITGHLMESSKDVLTALENLQQFTTVFTRLYSFYMETHDDELYYFCEPVEVWNSMSPETARQSVDMAYAGALHIVYLLTGKSIKPKRILYRYSRVQDLTEHEKILKCRPEFNQPCNCIVFSMADVKTPVIGYNKELNSIFKNLLEAEIRKQSEGKSFTDEVKHVLLKEFRVSFPQLEQIAVCMNLTPRTLQRKLQEENITFRVLCDSVKKELACSLLNNGRLSISQIAYKLGYADASSFQRAFRQWTGKSPNAFRANPDLTGLRTC